MVSFILQACDSVTILSLSMTREQTFVITKAGWVQNGISFGDFNC
jgi:hypothetical protein